MTAAILVDFLSSSWPGSTRPSSETKESSGARTRAGWMAASRAAMTVNVDSLAR